MRLQILWSRHKPPLLHPVWIIDPQNKNDYTLCYYVWNDYTAITRTQAIFTAPATVQIIVHSQPNYCKTFSWNFPSTGFCPLICRFAFCGFRYLQSAVVKTKKWKTPERNDSYILNCALFWAAWCNLCPAPRPPPPPPGWESPCPGHTLYTLASHESQQLPRLSGHSHYIRYPPMSHSSYLGYQVNCRSSTGLVFESPLFYVIRAPKHKKNDAGNSDMPSRIHKCFL